MISSPAEGALTGIVPAAFAALALAALSLPSRPDRLRGALGLPAFALGAASLPLLGDLRGAEPTLWISAALLLLAPALLLGAAWGAQRGRRLSAPPLILLLIAVGAALVAAWPTVRLGGVLPSLLTTGALALWGLLLWMVAARLRLGRAARWLDTRPALRPVAARAPSLVIGGAILVHVGWYIWPLWFELWQPVGLGIGVLAAWWAVSSARVPLALAGAAFASAFTAPEAAHGAWLILGAAALSNRVPARVTAAIAAAGGYLAAPPLLGSEVLLSVLLAGAATALLAALAAGNPGEGAAPR